MVIEFRGRAQFREFLDTVARVEEEGGTISPGGAAALLRVSRQRIHKLIHDNPSVRAWTYAENWLAQALTDRGLSSLVYIEISVRDLVRYGVRRGRLDSAADSGIWFPHLEDEIRQAKEELTAST